VASFTRLSPSRIVTTRRGTPSRWKNGRRGHRVGRRDDRPERERRGHAHAGTSATAATATAAVVKITSPTESSVIARKFRLKSRSDVK
jgi:hypothetical protein